MFKRLLFLFCTSLYINSVAQYTDLINSNRPGLSESPYGVGPGVYQIESNLFYHNSDASPIFDNPGAYGLGLHFRTGVFLEKLEANLSATVQNDIMSFTNVFTTKYSKFGLGELTLAAKYLVYTPKYNDMGKKIRSWNKRHSFDFKRWIPHVSPYVGVNFGNVLNSPHQRGGITPKFGVLLMNEFSNQFNLVSNVYYNYVGSDYEEWSYIITGTYFFGKQWSGFVEHQAKYNNFESTGNVGGGLAFLYTPNFQLNTSIRATFQDSGLGMYASIGASYRINRHIDKFTELDDYGNEVTDPDKKSYNKGFFGRIIDSILGIFKKKERVSVDTTDEEGNTKKKEVKVQNEQRKRKKSILRDIIKNDKKAKKRKAKGIEKASRRAKKDSIRKQKRLLKDQEKLEKQLRREQEKLERELKKEQEKLEKERLKEEKQQQKEEERLQKEIQELEKDLKKEEKQEKEKKKDDD